MAVHHVEVALVDRQVHGFADRAAGMVERFRQVGEFHEVAEILDARIAPPLVEVVDEWRAIGGGEHGVLAADLHVARRVPGVLREFARGGRLDQLAAQAPWHAHPFALYVRARGLPDRQGFRVFAKFDADLFEDRIGIVFDQGQPLFAEHFIERNLAGDVGNRLARMCGARNAFGLAGIGPPAPRGGCLLLIHGHSPAADGLGATMSSMVAEYAVE